ncbi:MAG: 6-bladed beta-propeller [Bacteroidales bacterium]|jgi:hypothetical protein|nr:6-bladed beta-propeller [Bacteroidales bacterium]
MKKLVIIWVSLICSAGFAQDLSKSRKAADMVTVEKHKVTVCNKSLLKDTVILPLSYFTEEMKIVKLDNSEQALASPGAVVIGEQYILARGSGNNPCKLFTKEGKYIANIGAKGKGPGEYQTVCDEVLDEKNNRIYILPWSSQSVLVYDLKGKVLDPVRLPMNVPKGKLFVDPSGTTISVFAVPFTGSKYIAWTQKVSGEVIGGIAPGTLAISPRDASGKFNGFNNEIMSGKNTSGMDAFLFTFGARLDTLYHYDAKANQLIPRFTVDYGSAKKIPIFTYAELPFHYMGSFSELKQVDQSTSVASRHVFFVIEKATLKGNYFKLKNDYLGDMEIGWPAYSFSNGYFTGNYDPGDLLDELEKALSNRKLSADARQKLTRLKSSISEKDNNYIFYAKLKQ